MGFIEKMECILGTKTFTENGAVSYTTSKRALLDFNFSITALRDASKSTIKNKFVKVFYEDQLMAVKYLFYLGDVRGGLGERRIYRVCMDWLSEKHPELAKVLLTFIPEYTRWDNLSRMIMQDSVRDEVADIIMYQLEKDLENMKAGRRISLCAKWLQSENSSSPETKEIGKRIRESLKMSSGEYRKMLSSLRAYADVVETYMSCNKWDKINYEMVPSRANLIYDKAFFKHDEKRRRIYLDAVNRGKSKINASVLQPHEITYRYRCRKCYDMTLEEMWKALPDLSIENTLVVRDGSASMLWRTCRKSDTTPLDVATALAIYMSEHNSGEWKHKYITFSSRPKVVNLERCRTLFDKVSLSLREADCSNTDIYATMKLILDTAVHENMSQEDMPKTIVICSDMQFNGRSHNFTKSLFDDISEEYEAYGYHLPRICFWNVDCRLRNTIPMQKNELGLILCSGFSIEILKMVMSGKTDPYDVLVEQLNSERYQPIENVIKDII